jgi:hypothetical protein
LPFGFDFFDLLRGGAENYYFFAVAVKTAVGVFVKFNLVWFYIDIKIIADFGYGASGKKAEKERN